MPNKIKQYIHYFLKEEKRLKYKLSYALGLLCELKNPVEQIKRSLKDVYKPLYLFKMLILIHQFLFYSTLDPCKTIELLSQLKSQAKPKQKFELDQLICHRIISPYTLYLQKCYQALSEGQYKIQQSQQNLYRIINILKQGLTIVDMLYIFGRYYQQKYEFFVDFNIILARDFGELYNIIKTILKKKKNLWNDRMKLQMQELHEKLYIVYYNCYFYREIKSFIPRWIDTDTSKNSIKKQSKQNRSVSSTKQNYLNKSYNLQSFTAKSRKVLKNISLNSTIGSYENQTTISSKKWIQQTQSQTLKFEQSKNQICQTVISQFQQNEQTDEIKQKEEGNRLGLLKSLQRVVRLIDEQDQSFSFEINI